jgi:putative flippase GtrA
LHQVTYKFLRELGFGSDQRILRLRRRGIPEALAAFLTEQFLLYAVMGSCAALVQLLLLASFVELVGMPSLMASTSALAISVVVNYGLQHRVTFRSEARHAVAGMRFAVLTLATLAANAILFSAVSAYLPYLLSQIITLGVIFPLNFFLNKTITFRA